MQVEEEERLWTQVIDMYGKLDAEWVSDIVSRAWGNRGNARSRQVRVSRIKNQPSGGWSDIIYLKAVSSPSLHNLVVPVINNLKKDTK